jgi:hypothetical protein
MMASLVHHHHSLERRCTNVIQPNLEVLRNLQGIRTQSALSISSLTHFWYAIDYYVSSPSTRLRYPFIPG